MIKEVISSLGLSQKEAKIYLAVIQGGKMTLSGLARKTGIAKTSLYPHLKDLLVEGYIKKTVSRKSVFYIAENPKKLVTKIENKKKDFLKILPGLSDSFSKSFDSPKVELYEGVEGLDAIYNDISKNALYIKTFFSPSRYLKVFSLRRSDKFIEDLSDRGIKVYTISEGDDESKRFFKEMGNRREAYKFLPKDHPLDTNIIIYNKKVVLISFENLTGLVIENPLITEFHKNNFNFYWDRL